MIEITDYETLLVAGKQQTEPQRFLFVFLKASLPEDHEDEDAYRFHSGQGGALEPIMYVDKALDDLSSFSDLVVESEQMGQDWTIVLIACLSGMNGVVPSSDEAVQPLEMMVQTVQNGGDLSKYMAFDRNGALIQFG